MDESPVPGEAAADYVVRLAAAKAVAGWRALPPTRAPVLAADTAVVLDGHIRGKPADREEGESQLLALAGRTHEVLTAVALATADGVEWRVSRSKVSFRPIGAAEARRYWETGEAHDKAGGYAVQGRAAVFIQTLKGSYSGVMGLPLYETAALLERAGVPRWR